MVTIYARRIKEGLMKSCDVPQRWNDAVTAKLAQ